MNSILSAEQIKKNFGREAVLKGVSLHINPNTFTAILGHSGCGKSTLLNILSGLLIPDSGQVLYKGESINTFTEKQVAKWKRSDVGHVFQNYLLLNNLTVEENIKIGIDPQKTSLAFDHLSDVLDLDEIRCKFPAQLSGGQQQRVAIARAVIKSPDILFCDEATGSLDETNSKKVVGLLHELKSTFGITILFTTHNQQIAKTADRILTMKDGILVKDEVNETPILPSEMVWG